MNGVPTSLVLDTGASVTLIHRDTWARNTSHPQELASWPSLKLVSADGSPLTVHGRARVNLQVEGEIIAIDAAIVSPLTTEAILGLDFLREHKALIDIPQKQLYLGDRQCTLPLREPAYGQPLPAAYGQSRDHTERERDHRMERRAHGESFKEGNLVWLYSSAAPRGHSRKLDRPWTGPYRFVKKLFEAAYRIQNVRVSRQRLVVRFNRLKPCPPHIRRPERIPSSPRQRRDLEPESSVPGQNLELVDEEPPQTAPASPRYPLRHRRPPEYLYPIVSH